MVIFPKTELNARKDEGSEARRLTALSVKLASHSEGVLLSGLSTAVATSWVSFLKMLRM